MSEMKRPPSLRVLTPSSANQLRDASLGPGGQKREMQLRSAQELTGLVFLEENGGQLPFLKKYRGSQLRAWHGTQVSYPSMAVAFVFFHTFD